MRGQTNSLDFVIGFMIFIIAATTFVSMSNRSEGPERPIDTVAMSNQLMNSGYPGDWNESSVIRLGILTNGTLDPNKWLMFKNLTDNDQISALLGTSDEFKVSVTGLPTITSDTATPNGNEIRRTQRIIAYNGSLAILEVIMWR